MLQVMMGALCALSFGVADFMASRSSRAIGARNALTGMLLMSTLALTAAVPFLASLQGLRGPGALLACIHGAAMASALLLFFRAMALGPVAVAAPIVAAHPVFIVAFALAVGSRPSGLQLAAMVAIIASLVVVGAGNPAGTEQPDEPLRRNSRKAVASALAASIIYAVAIISAQQAMRWSDEFAVLWLGRLSGLMLLAAVFAASRTRPALPMPWWPFFAVHGLLDSAGLLFLLLGSVGELDEITSVVASTFTMVTVGLAWFFYRERISPRRWAAIAVILVGVGVLAAGS